MIHTETRYWLQSVRVMHPPANRHLANTIKTRMYALRSAYAYLSRLSISRCLHMTADIIRKAPRF